MSLARFNVRSDISNKQPITYNSKNRHLVPSSATYYFRVKPLAHLPYHNSHTSYLLFLSCLVAPELLRRREFSCLRPLPY